MIKSLTVTNHVGESLTLELTRPEKSGLIVQSIEGLGPPKATVNMTELGLSDGSIFNSVRMENRNIVLTLAMMFDPIIEDARLKTYRYFPIKKKVKLTIKTDRRTVETEGYIESNEPDIFSEEETTVISIVCPDSCFYEPSENVRLFTGIEPLFEFPFSNESVTENLLEMGNTRIDKRIYIDYVGDVDSGVYISIRALDDVRGIRLYNVGTRESFALDTDKLENIIGGTFTKGDEILISTVRGQKYARFVQGAKTTNIIGSVDKNSDWFQLTNGTNIFDYAVDEGRENLIISFTYRAAYGGV